MTGDICPRSRRTDGPKHSWAFDGDDPYVICAFCDEMRDAHTGLVLRPATADPTPEPEGADVCDACGTDHVEGRWTADCQ